MTFLGLKPLGIGELSHSSEMQYDGLLGFEAAP